MGFCKDMGGIVVLVVTTDPDCPNPGPCADPPLAPAVVTTEAPPAIVDPVPPFPPFTASSVSLSNPMIVMLPSVLVVANEAFATAVATSAPDKPCPDPSPTIPVHQIIAKKEGGKVKRVRKDSQNVGLFLASSILC